FLASALLSQAPALPQVETLTRFLDPDARVLMYTIVLGLFTALVCGLVPALRATQTDPMSVLKDDGGAFNRRLAGSWLGRSLVIGQLTLSMVLLIASGLLLRGVVRSASVTPGFDAANLLFLVPRAISGRNDRQQTERFLDEL